MERTVDDAIRAIDSAKRSELKTTPEHRGFGIALDAVREELGGRSPVIEAGSDRAILKIDRPTLVAAIEEELERPAGKLSIAERIADGIGELIGVRILEAGDVLIENDGGVTVRITESSDGTGEEEDVAE